jgi:hypothetical protein
MDHCIICKEKCLIPVEIICFNCYKKNEINCSSFLRICFLCSINYLELNKSRYDRSYSKKCLYCSEFALLHFISIKSAVKIDFLLMSMDVRPDYTCSFCQSFHGTQIDIYKHVSGECPNFWIECMCDRVFYKCDLNDHRTTCNEYSKCPECCEYIVKYEFQDHMKSIHDLGMCRLCKKYILDYELDLHAQRHCEFRSVLCEYCLKFCDYRSWKNHLNTHLNDLCEEINKLNYDYSSLLKRHELLNDLYERY